MKMKLVIKEPNKPAKVCELSGNDTLAIAQKAVGGYVQSIAIGPEVSILVDEDGLSKNLPDNCGFVGTFVFVQEVLISKEEGYDWGSLNEENVRKALAWCEKHSEEVHPDKSGSVIVITGDNNIKTYREQLASDAQSKLMEWQSL